MMPLLAWMLIPIALMSLPMATAWAGEGSGEAAILPERVGAGGTFTATGRFSEWDDGRRIVPLSDGTVFVYNDATADSDRPYTFDQRTGTRKTLPFPPECRNSARRHLVTALPGDLVLITGGVCRGYRKVSLWDGASRAWLTAPQLNQARLAYTATPLADGSVLIVGGVIPAEVGTGPALDSVELFTHSNVEQLEPLNVARAHHTATPLPDGSVLVVGGTDVEGTATASAELWDPASRAWRSLPPMKEARVEHSATLLMDGRVVVAGGKGADGRALRSVEFWDPRRKAWTSGEELLVPRAGHSAVRLASGDVLLVGDTAVEGPSVALAMLWSSTTGHWRPAGMLLRDMRLGTATIVPDDAGGATVYGAQTIATWKPAALAGQPNSLYDQRFSFSATVLKDSRVLLAGGSSSEGVLVDWVELFDPNSNEFLFTGRMHRPRSGHTAQLLSDGRVVVAGGEVRTEEDRHVPWVADHPEVWDPRTGDWRVVDAVEFGEHDSVEMRVLDDERVLFFAARAPSGADPGGYRAWIWNPQNEQVETRSFSMTPRRSPAVAVLGNGQVLVAGGRAPTAVQCDPALDRESLTEEEGENDCVRGPALVWFQDYHGAELLDALSGQFIKIDPPDLPLTGIYGNLVLQNGDVLLSNLYDEGPLGRIVVRWRAATKSWDALPPVPAGTWVWPMAELDDGSLATGTVMLPAGGTQWEQVELQGAVQRIVTLPSGKVLGLSSEQPQVLSFDQARAAWQIHDNAYVPRTRYPAVAVLPDGDLFVSGGISASKKSVVQIWNPKSGIWSHAGQLKGEYLTHKAVTLPSGRVIQAGHAFGLGNQHTIMCEIGYPRANDWESCGSIELHTSGVMNLKELTMGTLPDGRAALMVTPDRAYVYSEEHNTWDMMKTQWSSAPLGAPVRLEKPFLSLFDRRTETWIQANGLGAQFEQANRGGSMFWDEVANQFAFVFSDTAGKNAVRLRDGCILIGPPLGLMAAASGAIARYAGSVGVTPRDVRLVALADDRFAILGEPEGVWGFGAGFFTGRASCAGIDGFEGPVAASRETVARGQVGVSERKIIVEGSEWKTHFYMYTESTPLNRFPWATVLFLLIFTRIAFKARKNSGSTWWLAATVLLAGVLIYVVADAVIREVHMAEKAKTSVPPLAANADVGVPRVVPCDMVGIWTMRRDRHAYRIILDGDGKFHAEENISARAITPPEKGTWGIRDNQFLWADSRRQIFAMHEIVSRADGKFRLIGPFDAMEDFEMVQALPKNSCSNLQPNSEPRVRLDSGGEFISSVIAWKDHALRNVESTVLYRFRWAAAFFVLLVIGVVLNVRSARPSWRLTTITVLLVGLLIFMAVRVVMPR